MLDIAFIRENREKVKKGVLDKQLDPKIVDTVLSLDEKRRKLIGEVEDLRSERNKLAKEKNIEEGKKLKTKLKKLEPQLKEAEEDFEKAMLLIPNPGADDVKSGKDERENEILRKWGEKPEFSFKVKDHLE